MSDSERIDDIMMYAVCVIFIAFGIVMLVAAVIGVYAFARWVIGG